VKIEITYRKGIKTMLYKNIRDKKFNIKKSILVVLIFIIVISVMMNLNEIKQINLSRFVTYISNYGKYAAICFLLIFSLKPLLLFLPSSMLSIAAGMIFGPIVGFLLNMAGFFLSATLGFYLSRFLGKDFVDKLLKGKAISVNSNLENNGIKILFFIRFTPVIPFDAISYACGLSKMRYKDFIIGSMLGVFFETLCYAFIGESILDPFSYKFIIPAGLVILAICITTYIYKRKKEN